MKKQAQYDFLISYYHFVFPQTFFKVFFSVVLFGLYHGLVFLPVLLSYIGPAAHEHSEALQSNSLSKQKSIEDGDKAISSDVDRPKSNQVGVEYRSPKDFVTRSEFNALALVD